MRRWPICSLPRSRWQCSATPLGEVPATPQPDRAIGLGDAGGMPIGGASPLEAVFYAVIQHVPDMPWRKPALASG